MNTKHIALFAFTALSLFHFSPVEAQDADNRTGDLINQSDWFRLEEEYPELSDKIQTGPLKELAEIMLASYFNRPQEAVVKIDTLLSHNQDFLGFNSTCNLVALRAKLIGEQGYYADAADQLYDFLNQVDAFASRKDFPGHQQLADFYNQIRDVQAPSVVRPEKDTEISFTIEKAGRGILMFIPVGINGKTYKFIFDTGAGSTFLSSRLAKEMGLRILRDSLTINGAVASETGRSGLIDSMTIGDITFKNSIVSIANPNPAVDTVYQVDAVLGSDFMRLVGEAVIYPQTGKIVFPVHKTPLPDTGRNMMFYDGAMSLKLYSGNELLRFCFDTGDVKASLFKCYYEKHKTEIDKTALKDTITSGGFGGVRKHEVLCLESLPLQIGKTAFEIPGIHVEPEDLETALRNEKDGSLGMDFIKLFDKVIISLDNMFVEARLPE